MNPMPLRATISHRRAQNKEKLMEEQKPEKLTHDQRAARALLREIREGREERALEEAKQKSMSEKPTTKSSNSET